MLQIPVPAIYPKEMYVFKAKSPRKSITVLSVLTKNSENIKLLQKEIAW